MIQFNILQKNVCSLAPRSISLQHLLAFSKCSIAIFFETWLSPCTFNLPHFDIFRCNRDNGYSEVAIATHNSLNIRLIYINLILKQSCLVKKINIIGVEVLNIKNISPISFWSCCIPIDSHISLELWNSLFLLANDNCFFGGDFNAHNLAWGSTSSSRRDHMLYSTINSLGLSILNTGNNTYLGKLKCSNSAIEISFSSSKLTWLSYLSVMDDSHGSDHFPIIISINNNINSNFSHISCSNALNNSFFFFVVLAWWRGSR